MREDPSFAKFHLTFLIEDLILCNDFLYHRQIFISIMLL